MMRSPMIFALFVGALLAAVPAVAANKSLAKERQAKRACLSGDYVTGVGILAALFVETNDPNYLSNQGRCFEQNVRYVEAAERFKEYLRKATSLTADDKADAEKHIADCEAAAAKGQTRNLPATEPALAVATPLPPAGPPPSSSSSSPNPDATPADAVPPAATVTTTPPDTADVTYGWPHTVKWIAAGVAVAGLGFGVVEHWRYYGKNRDYNNDPNCPNGTSTACKGLADSADLAQTLAFVGYGIAAVATGAAIALWLVDSPVSKSQVSVGFSCAPTVAGVACAGQF
jgi:hypothetical protein